VSKQTPYPRGVFVSTLKKGEQSITALQQQKRRTGI